MTTGLTILYEDDSLLVVDKPAGVVVFPEGQTTSGTLIEHLVEEKPELKQAGEAPRYGVVHRLDKDTSGILLVAKTSEALIFLQKEFISRRVEKKYLCLVEGSVKEEQGVIETLLGRSTQDPRKQTVWRSATAAPGSAREAVTKYQVIQRFQGYTLLAVGIETGRRHQIRAHLAHLQHPIAGDKLYRFKHSPHIPGLDRQFLHATYLKIQLPARNASHSDAGGPSERVLELHSPLPEELQAILVTLDK